MANEGGCVVLCLRISLEKKMVVLAMMTDGSGEMTLVEIVATAVVLQLREAILKKLPGFFAGLDETCLVLRASPVDQPLDLLERISNVLLETTDLKRPWFRVFVDVAPTTARVN